MPQSPARTTFLVEHYRPGSVESRLSREAIRIRAALDRHGEDAPIWVVGTVLVPADEAFLLLIEATDEAEIEARYRTVGASFDRISETCTDLRHTTGPRRALAGEDLSGPPHTTTPSA